MCEYTERTYTSAQCELKASAQGVMNTLVKLWSPDQGEEPHRITYRTYHACQNAIPAEGVDQQFCENSRLRVELRATMTEEITENAECRVCEGIKDAAKKAERENKLEIRVISYTPQAVVTPQPLINVEPPAPTNTRRRSQRESGNQTRYRRDSRGHRRQNEPRENRGSRRKTTDDRKQRKNRPR
ncbi:hypothetical protein BP6252_10901 [Coleophoma cylindrospora]|uniref:Uncharacterized protein n=1 Tax=Coleophoma cylindrospora TaxID=1849047 RepID=A0A3D8QNF2_9HELO|nr:hypothetical protein BP6252_10901 [Coleophoma cylindrospora]